MTSVAQGRISGSARPSPLWLGVPFSISGCAALVYQIVWQRVLFASFGVNIESVTIIVSVFMFGLGVGSLVGGALSKRFPSRLAQMFLACELGIGLFGAVSLPLMHGVARVTLHASLPATALTAYALLSVPTILMGATLPILVTLVHRHDTDVGRTVSALYFLNTAGSALACFLTVDVLFVEGGLRSAVLFACLCNVLVVLLVYLHVWRTSAGAQDGSAARVVRLLHLLLLALLLGCAMFFSFPTRLVVGSLAILGVAWWLARGSARDPRPETALPSVARDSDASRNAKANAEAPNRRRFLLVLVLSAAVGYVALSQEILWFRVIGYMTGGRPNVFGHLLGFLLAGIALGAITLRPLYARARGPKAESVLVFVAAALAVSGLLFYATVPAIGALAKRPGGLALDFAYGSVLVVALSVGSIFPALCHHGVESGAAVGSRVSWVYFANIVGSTAGPLLTGFVLLEAYSLQQMVLYLSLGTLTLSAIVWLQCPLSSRTRAAAALALALGMGSVALVHGAAFDHLLERLHYKTGYAADRAYKDVVQNRSGIVAVGGKATDIVYGGGVFDGSFNVDPLHDTNGIHRAYMFAALHPAPRDVLEIGLSSGSWTRVLASNVAVEHLTVVEINPAYRELIARHADAAPLLSDPKVVIHFDDGRRWLERNPEPRFDFILMNMTFHWRDHATSLLSEEFLRLCKAHLNEGGVIYYNATSSADVPYTAARVFAHVTHYGSFVAASDRPFVRSTQDKRRSLLEFFHDGRPTLAEDGARGLLDSMANAVLPDDADSLRHKAGLWCITDDNMAVEFKSFWREMAFP